MKKVIIVGAGPAGLTAAYELLKRGDGKFDVTVLEGSNCIGGISKTVTHNGNRMDMGGHRFFSKIPGVNEWWQEILPMQGAPSSDDIELNREIPLAKGGPDPEKTDEVMLTRHRVSRIYFDGKFYDYPVSLKMQTLKNMGFANTMKVGFSYLGAMVKKRPEDNLENFYINRFGKKLYSMFFEYYTENLWGRHPRDIDASWGAQRVKGISVSAVLKDMFGKAFNKKDREVETSLIEEFKYPKMGPGQLWEVVAKHVTDMGGKILMESEVTKIHKTGNSVDSVIYENNGRETELKCDYFISTMPIKDLLESMNDVPENPLRIAKGLPYRDYMTLGVLVPKLNLKNLTDLPTISNIVPDCWIYVQDRNVKMGRLQVYNNWSPYMIKDIHNTVWVGLEYFVTEGDIFWAMSEDEFAKFGISEMIKVGLIDNPDDVMDYHMEKVKKAYPAYFDTYDEIDKLKDYLGTIDNLYCVGRNGQHRYNNLDHSMDTSFKASKEIIAGNPQDMEWE